MPRSLTHLRSLFRFIYEDLQLLEDNIISEFHLLSSKAKEATAPHQVLLMNFRTTELEECLIIMSDPPMVLQ